MATQFILLSVALPLFFTVIVGSAFESVAARHLHRNRDGRGITVAMVLGVFAGFVAVNEIDALRPDRYWQWFGWMLCAAGAIGLSSGRKTRLLTYAASLALAVFAAFMLVPDWNNLQPSRWIWQVVVFGLILCSLAASHSVARRTGTMTSILLWITMLSAVSALVAMEVSLRIAEMGIAVLAASVGGLLVALRFPIRPDARTIAPIPAVAASVLAFVGCIEPTPPKWIFLAVPLTPICSLAIPPSGGEHRARRSFFRLALVALALGVLATVLIL